MSVIDESGLRVQRSLIRVPVCLDFYLLVLAGVSLYVCGNLPHVLSLAALLLRGSPPDVTHQHTGTRSICMTASG